MAKKTGINAPIQVDEVATEFFLEAKKIPAKFFKDGKKHTITKNGQISRGHIAKAVWAYIKQNELNEGRTIHFDETLQDLFDTNKKKCEMTQMTKLYNNFIEN